MASNPANPPHPPPMVNATAKAARGVVRVIKADVAVTAAVVVVAPKAAIVRVVTARAPKGKTPAANLAGKVVVNPAVNIAAVVANAAVAAVIVASVAPAEIAAVPILAPKAIKAAERSDRSPR